ncbi:MAG: SDR family oxidoreductase [Treponema sp.]|nr:SDR family oxidoreductase [Treponema sp.]
MNDIYRLDGQLSLVTGASKGIGAAVAKALARQGSDVLLLARDIQKLNAVADDIRAMGRDAKTFQVDVSDTAQVNAFLGSQKAILEKLDNYINNAGFTVYKTFMESSVEDLDNLVAVNVRGAISLVHGVAGFMKKRGAGCITFVTSINGLNPLPSQAFYSSTKAMLESLMKSMAVELAGYGIRVNSVVPGAINTDMNPHFSDPERLKRTEEKIPCGRVGISEEIADVAAFLCSGAARYMYGSSVVVDGGFSLRK